MAIKMCKKCNKNKKRRSKVSGFDSQEALNFDFMEIGVMAAGAVGVNLAVNPILNAIWKNKTVPKFGTALVKGGIAIALNAMDNSYTKTMAKGVMINLAGELINKIAPDAMKNKLKDPAVEGIGMSTTSDIEYIDLAAELNGIGDLDTSVAGMEEYAGSYGGW